MADIANKAEAASGRLLLLSNRLPITIKRSEDGKYSFSMSSGGLVTGLSGLSKTTNFLWYGWPGLEVPDNEVDHMKKHLKDEYGAHPVFIDDETADRHYNGFASAYLYSSPLSYPPSPYPLPGNPKATQRQPEADHVNRLDPVAPLPLPPRRNHL